MPPKLIFVRDKLCNITTQCPFSPPYLSGTVGLTRGWSVLDGTFLHTASDTGRQEEEDRTPGLRNHTTLALMEAINHIQGGQTIEQRFILFHMAFAEVLQGIAHFPLLCCEYLPELPNINVALQANIQHHIQTFPMARWDMSTHGSLVKWHRLS